MFTDKQLQEIAALRASERKRLAVEHKDFDELCIHENSFTLLCTTLLKSKPVNKLPAMVDALEEIAAADHIQPVTVTGKMVERFKVYMHQKHSLVWTSAEAHAVLKAVLQD